MMMMMTSTSIYIPISGEIVPTLDPDSESDIQLFRDSESGFGSSKKMFWKTFFMTPGLIRIGSWIFSLLAILNPDSDPVKVEL